MDGRESHGEVPGTAAYELRTQDAVPDEVEIVPEGQQQSSRGSRGSRPSTPVGGTVPKMVIDKIDPLSPSHGEVPGTHAHSKRMADAVPDEIRSASSPSSDISAAESPSVQASNVPTTLITRVDSQPSHGEVPGTQAFDLRTEDAKPDHVEKKGAVHSE